MPKKSELIRSAEAELKRLDIHIFKLNNAMLKAKAEYNAYQNLIEWTNSISKKKVEKK